MVKVIQKLNWIILNPQFLYCVAPVEGAHVGAIPGPGSPSGQVNPGGNPSSGDPGKPTEGSPAGPAMGKLNSFLYYRNSKCCKSI